MAAVARAVAPKPKTLRFDQKLVLNRYMLRLFGVGALPELAEGLEAPEHEGWGEDNVSHFHRLLAARFRDRLPELNPPGPSEDDLLRYDANIYRHTQHISARREQPVRWKYFQYLALLFTELYLDQLFRDPDGLLRRLNAELASYNALAPAGDRIGKYAPDDLRTVAFWMATGSGKTLLMHANILQYLHYQASSGTIPGAPSSPITLDSSLPLNRIILLTPNEGLSRQHRAELELSGIPAELFDKEGGQLFARQTVQIIDIHKLGEQAGEKTVAVDAFEGNNLVLVDEGHRGAGGDVWKEFRDRLSRQGFSFEYSATFGQAIKAATGTKGKQLAQEYGRCTLFDYSYKYFHKDGYGKEYQILNLEEEGDDATRHRYLSAALLAFYQQQLLYEQNTAVFAPHGLERPLWVFVGGSVAATSSKETTDVVDILLFLARFVREREESIENLRILRSGNTGLQAKGRDLFANKYAALAGQHPVPEALFGDILRRLFNASSGAELRVEVRKGAEGEIALRLGGYPPFGVVNVGDARGLARECEKRPELIVADSELGGSLFGDLNTPRSRIHLLIGSRKFTEGWSSWRVSSMGLMNIGKNEGAQIIQLFGRGVRLKGLGYSLKRSTALPNVLHPQDVRHLETLNVFGVHADYMRRFEEELAAEVDSPPPQVEIVLPVVSHVPEGKLKMVRLREGMDFKRDGLRPTLGPLPVGVLRPVLLDWYPKLQALESRGESTAVDKETGNLAETNVAWMDLDAVVFELVRYKQERGWHNLQIDRPGVLALLGRQDWYTLSIPKDELAFGAADPLRRVRVWQEIAVALLKKYCDRFYKLKRDEYEQPHRHLALLREDDDNILTEYTVTFPETDQTLATKLAKLKVEIARGKLAPRKHGVFEAFTFDRHLYRPLVHLKKGEVSVKPVALNEGERSFVEDLRTYYEGSAARFDGTELYLLRNLSLGKGVGFFEAGNFYPDFIMWLLAGDHQHIAFIDPKGIRNLGGPDDPKIRFHDTIKEIERTLKDPNVTMSSFIVSNTPYAEVGFWLGDKAEFARHNVLFQTDDKATYIEAMFDRILNIPS